MKLDCCMCKYYTPSDIGLCTNYTFLKNVQKKGEKDLLMLRNCYIIGLRLY